MTAPILTLFTTVKPFVGDIARIQRNAIKSWLALRPRPEIILFGNEFGAAEVCREFGLIHVPNVAAAPSGAPYLDDLFEKAQRVASNQLLCYVNADIILLQDFLTAVESVLNRLGPSILIATPWNVRVDEDLDLSAPGWPARLRSLINREGNLLSPRGADVFLFPKGAYKHLPRLVIGRWWWDNLLMYAAARSGLPAVDVTAIANAIHQAHVGSTHPGSVGLVVEPSIAKEIAENKRALSYFQQRFYRVDLPWVVQPDGAIRRRPVPHLAFLFRLMLREAQNLRIKLLIRTFRVRRVLGLYRWWRHP